MHRQGFTHHKSRSCSVTLWIIFEQKLFCYSGLIETMFERASVNVLICLKVFISLFLRGCLLTSSDKTYSLPHFFLSFCCFVLSDGVTAKARGSTFFSCILVIKSPRLQKISTGTLSGLRCPDLVSGRCHLLSFSTCTSYCWVCLT